MSKPYCKGHRRPDLPVNHDGGSAGRDKLGAMIHRRPTLPVREAVEAPGVSDTTIRRQYKRGVVKRIQAVGEPGRFGCGCVGKWRDEGLTSDIWIDAEPQRG